MLRPRVIPSNPRTPKQVQQRELFRRLTQAGSALLDGFVKPYWQRFAGTGQRATTAFNAFVYLYRTGTGGTAVARFVGKVVYYAKLT